MKYIAKAKGANRFKAVESISDFTPSDFEGYELFEVKAVEPKQYGEILKEQKIQELKEQLTELGVDMSTLFGQQAPPAQQSVPNSNIQEQTNESPLLMSDDVDGNPSPPQTGEVTKIINKENGKPFTMRQMTEIFEEFRAKIEKEVPEIMYSMCTPEGFRLVMSEPRKDIPTVLPNGIPLRQVQG